MRSRSTRLFIVLLHMVGVSRNLPKITSKSFTWNVGIVGVHPQHILSEYIDLTALQAPTGEIIDGRWHDPFIDIPFWLLDDTDGKCLGPLGKFAECGDATLWRLRRARRKRSNKSHKEARDNEQDYDVLYALQVLDVLELYSYDNDEPSSVTTDEKKLHPVQRLGNFLGNQQDYNKFRQRQELLKRSDHFVTSEHECLIMDPNQRRKQGKMSTTSPLQLGSCASPHAWTWRVDGKGILRHEGTLTRENTPAARIEAFSKALLWNVLAYGNDKMRSEGGGNNSRPPQNTVAPLCVHRSMASNAAMLATCDEEMQTDYHWRQVSFSLARYQTTAGTGTASSPSVVIATQHGTGIGVPNIVSTAAATRAPSAVQRQNASVSSAVGTEAGVTRQLDSSTIAGTPTNLVSEQSKNSSAIVVNRHLEVRDVSRKRDIQPMNSLIMIPLNTKQTASIIRGSHPALISRKDNGRDKKERAGSSRVHRLPSNVGGRQKRIHVDARDRKIQSSSHQVGTTHWKIPRHPYIETSRNEVWVDPLTGLEYLTDLCRYLGHDRKSSGRHTLVGVGQYTRTALKIKVYGAALYVSKRDVLSNPSFADYAHLTAEQLRRRTDFYDLLMGMGASSGFDRTLLIKLNMQLSTETIRSSLHADWKMLTEEMKSLLIGTSFKARQAEEPMLKLIQSPSNPSRCSCGQLAPEVYKADPSCCARGTELVFTWRKNGSLELRLDGRNIDTFPRPDVARGIFFEYLRSDDPISVDARDHFVDGFPFLLAPLAQVRGVTSAQQQYPPETDGKQRSSRGSSWNIFGYIFSGISRSANDATSWVKSGIGETVSGAVGVSKAVGRTAKSVGDDFNQRKDEVGEHVASITLSSMEFIVRNIPFVPESWREGMFGASVVLSGDDQEWGARKNRQSLRGAAPFDIIEEISSVHVDEIGVIVHPTMNFTHKLFSTTVHLYLMLLLIVSLPGTQSTRMVIKRAGKGRSRPAKEVRLQFQLPPREPVKVESDGGRNVTSIPSRNESKYSDKQEGAEQPSTRLTQRFSPEAAPITTMKKSLSYYV